MSKIGQPTLAYPATQEKATNKLLHAAQFEIPAPGRWQLEVLVEGALGTAVVSCEVEAAEPLSRWSELWPWICCPALAIALFGLHQVSVQRRMGQAAQRRPAHTAPALKASKRS
jgi:hypothetical protein